MFYRGKHIAPSLNELRNATPAALDFATIAELAFPNNDDLPAGLPQLMYIARIPCPVGLNFVPPERGIRFRNMAGFAPVTMPKAPVNEDDRTCRGKHYVGSARKTSHVDAVTHSHPMKSAPERQFWSCVT
jgi:hypothetical protein